MATSCVGIRYTLNRRARTLLLRCCRLWCVVIVCRRLFVTKALVDSENDKNVVMTDVIFRKIGSKLTLNGYHAHSPVWILFYLKKVEFIVLVGSIICG